MTYDKDIRVRVIVYALCGAVVGVAVAKLLPLPVIAAAALMTMIWAVLSLREIKQKQGELERMISEFDQTTLQKLAAGHLIDRLKGSGQPEKIAEGMAIEHLFNEAYGYRSFTCPKCGRLSHIPKEVEPYCIECLAELSERG